MVSFKGILDMLVEVSSRAGYPCGDAEQTGAWGEAALSGFPNP